MALGGAVGNFAGPAMIELIALAGADAAHIDMEHHPFDLREIEGMILTAEAVGITPIIRIPELDAPLILRLLDMGAQCIQLDGISNPDEARALVDACRYPPAGSRGLVWTSRPARYGRVDKRTFAAEANRNVVVKISIDSEAGLNALDEIAAVEGIDIIGVGAHDLSSILGVVGYPDHPKLVAAIDQVIAAVSKGGRRRLALPLGSSAYPRTPAELMARGVVYTNLAPILKSASCVLSKRRSRTFERRWPTRRSPIAALITPVASV